MARRRKKSGKNLLRRAAYGILLILSTLGALKLAPEVQEPAGTVEGGLSIHFIDVGQADAAVVQCGGETLMIDGGNAADSSLIYSYLTNTLRVEHIDYMIATHPHEDHIGGLPGALNACTVGKVFSPVTEHDTEIFKTFKQQVEKQGVQLTIPSVGEQFTLGGASVQFLSPVKKFTGTNDWSIVVRIVYGSTSFLFTGDAEWDAEHEMADSGYNLSSTLLKVGHHGSDTSSAYVFLREVMPDYAVISVGEGNRYGHPSEATLSRLRDAGAEIWRTDQQGHIVVHSDGKQLQFSSEKGANASTGAAAPANPSAGTGRR